MVKHGDMYRVKFHYDLTNMQDIPMDDLGKLPVSAINNLPIACDGDNCQWWQECLTDKDDWSLIKTLVSGGATKAGSKLRMGNELDMVKSDKGWISER